MSKVKPSVQPVLTPEQAAVVADLDRIAGAVESLRERAEAISLVENPSPLRSLHQLAAEVAVWAARLPDPPAPSPP
jgi:hypothetical protein